MWGLSCHLPIKQQVWETVVCSPSSNPMAPVVWAPAPCPLLCLHWPALPSTISTHTA